MGRLPDRVSGEFSRIFPAVEIAPLSSHVNITLVEVKTTLPLVRSGVKVGIDCGTLMRMYSMAYTLEVPLNQGG